jgi:predicted amino acid racemase
MILPEIPSAGPFPELAIDLDILVSNVRALAGLCRERGVSLTGVVKGADGLPPVARAMLAGGCGEIASSRIGQLRTLREAGIGSPLVLVRVPAPGELAEVARWADRSLHSDLSVLRALDREADRAGRRHGVVLMLDLGDLREGWFEEAELVEAAVRAERDLPALELLGIGTNLGCYGSILPTPENLGRLAGAASRIEDRIGRTLEVVSGGATSSIPLLLAGKLPRRINNLRVGEGLLAARDLPHFHKVDVPGLSPGVVTLRAEVIEVRTKPSHPVGEIFIDAFGERPTYRDRGSRKRALLAVGKQDFGKHESLVPREPGIEVIGSSSDHLICDVEDLGRPLAAGDILEFGLFYPALLFASQSRYVRKTFRGGEKAG